MVKLYDIAEDYRYRRKWTEPKKLTKEEKEKLVEQILKQISKPAKDKDPRVP